MTEKETVTSPSTGEPSGYTRPWGGTLMLEPVASSTTDPPAAKSKTAETLGLIVTRKLASGPPRVHWACAMAGAKPSDLKEITLEVDHVEPPLPTLAASSGTSVSASESSPAKQPSSSVTADFVLPHFTWTSGTPPPEVSTTWPRNEDRGRGGLGNFGSSGVGVAGNAEAISLQDKTLGHNITSAMCTSFSAQPILSNLLPFKAISKTPASKKPSASFVKTTVWSPRGCKNTTTHSLSGMVWSRMEVALLFPSAQQNLRLEHSTANQCLPSWPISRVSYSEPLSSATRNRKPTVNSSPNFRSFASSSSTRMRTFEGPPASQYVTRSLPMQGVGPPTFTSSGFEPEGLNAAMVAPGQHTPVNNPRILAASMPEPQSHLAKSS
mmetsp:Transcript_166849/g.535551  ORF Transcript_166849/g.535551 Transcript_166849/m.535551 type:complete len:381 (+) Transcript_166849:666-1808(+)